MQKANTTIAKPVHTTLGDWTAALFDVVEQEGGDAAGLVTLAIARRLRLSAPRAARRRAA